MPYPGRKFSKFGLRDEYDHVKIIISDDCVLIRLCCKNLRPSVHRVAHYHGVGWLWLGMNSALWLPQSNVEYIRHFSRIFQSCGALGSFSPGQILCLISDGKELQIYPKTKLVFCGDGKEWSSVGALNWCFITCSLWTLGVRIVQWKKVARIKLVWVHLL